MKVEGWLGLGGVDPVELSDARLEAHHAVQMLASFGQALVESRDDDSHRSLSWDARGRAFLSEPTDGTPWLQLGLAPERLELAVFAGGERVAGRTLLGMTVKDARGWVEDELRRIPGCPEDLRLEPPEFEIPDHPVGGGEMFGAAAEESALLEVCKWFANASGLLSELRSTEPSATEVRCWPHHFDIATLLVLDPELGAEKGRSVGVGLSPGDDGYPQPYWYVTPYPYPENADLPELPSGGRWHTEGWVGAVLTGDAIAGIGTARSQAEAAAEFVTAAVAASRALLDAQG